MTKRGWGECGSGPGPRSRSNLDWRIELSLYAKFRWSRLTRSWLKVCVFFLLFYLLFYLLFNSDYSVLAQLGYGLAWLGLAGL